MKSINEIISNVKRRFNKTLSKQQKKLLTHTAKQTYMYLLIGSLVESIIKTLIYDKSPLDLYYMVLVAGLVFIVRIMIFSLCDVIHNRRNI